MKQSTFTHRQTALGGATNIPTMTSEQVERQLESARILGDWLAENYPTSEPDIAVAALDTLKLLHAKVHFWTGPARIVEAPRSPESSRRYWEVYCTTCRTHECLFDHGDPRLTERRDEHNRAHAESPLRGLEGMDDHA